MELSSIIKDLKNGAIPEILKQHKWVSLKYIIIPYYNIYIIFY